MAEQKRVSYDSIDIQVLKRYFEGSCSKAEKALVAEWFGDPAYEKVLQYKLKEHWEEYKAPAETKMNSEVLLDRIHHKMHLKEWEKSHKLPLYRKLYRQYSKIAAAVLLPLLLLGGWYLFGGEGFRKGEQTYVEIHSPPSARTRFELPDGSWGWLNSGSSLKFPASFTASRREVSLIGEGYFDVSHDPKHPFVVTAGKSEVVALGTSFNVMAWPGEEQTTVTMESGVTEFYSLDGDNETTKIARLGQGEQLVYSMANKEIRKSKVRAEYFTSWKDGKLIFRNENMSEVLKKLGRWYNVDFFVDDQEIVEYRYRATFNDESLEEVLKLLEQTSPIAHEVMERESLPDGSYTKKRIRLYINQ